MQISKFQALALFGLATGSLLLPSCKGNDSQGGAAMQSAPQLAVMTVGVEDANLETAYPTTLQGENDVEIRPQVQGFLTKVHVEEGQHVAKGQVLFTIDQVQLQAAVDQAAASVAVAQANVNTAQTSATNNKILFDKNIISASAYQTSVDALNAAKAQLNQANAALTSARKNLSYSSVTAPVSGVVGRIDNKEGTLVSPSTLLTILSNNSEMQANFAMTEKEVLQYTGGSSSDFKAAIAALPEVQLQLANGEIYPLKGKIVSVSGVINSSTGSANAKAVFPNPDGVLRSGNTGNVLLPTVFHDAIAVPQNATYDIQDMKFVFVVGDSSKVHTRPITVSPLEDGKNFIVTSGLQPGETIVVEGVGVNVQDGMTITPKSGDSAAAGQDGKKAE